MKTRKIIGLVASGFVMAGLAGSCSESFLDQPPQGAFQYPSFTTKAGIEGFLINAYASLKGPAAGWYTSPINWVWGSVTSDEAYKGSEKSDQSDVNPIQRFEVLPSNPLVKNKWDAIYNSIARANVVLTTIPDVDDLTAEEVTRITGEARFLRGLNHLEAVKVYGKVPFVDELETEFKNSNTTPIWSKIEEDFQYGYTNLPEIMPAIGRANKWAAAAYLAKTLMFQGKFNKALPILDDIIDNGKTSAGVKYALHDKYNDNFTVANENGKEAIFGMQFSVGDGSTTNGNYEMTLAYPAPIFTGCCGFYQPSQNLVNSFRTDADGLPFLDTFDDTNIDSDENVLSSEAWTPTGKYLKDGFVTRRDPGTPAIERVYKSLNGVKNAENIGHDPATSPDDWVLAWTESTQTVDPRLDWTVGRRDIDYLDYGVHPGRNWIRDIAYSGPYSPKKNVFSKAERDAGQGGAAGWGWNNNAKNFVLVRLADVYLWRAEARAETGDLPGATEDVNKIRNRAKNPLGVVREGNNPANAPAANYLINPYPINFATEAEALKAIRFERKLELAMEGHRFFDLVRWGIAETVMDAYLEKEGTRRVENLGDTDFKPRNIHMPIHETTIINSEKNGAATLEQVDGY